MSKKKQILRPRGIFPSLPGGIDRVIKSYFDGFRSTNTQPPELIECENIKLYNNQKNLDMWRDWRSGLEYRDDSGNILFGALDDLAVNGDCFVPLDYKTKGSPTTQEDATRYYQLQLDCYSLMLEANKMKTCGYGLLLYYSPKSITAAGMVKCVTQILKINTSPDRARKIFNDAINLLSGNIPAPSAHCEYCAYLHKGQGFS